MPCKASCYLQTNFVIAPSNVEYELLKYWICQRICTFSVYFRTYTLQLGYFSSYRLLKSAQTDSINVCSVSFFFHVHGQSGTLFHWFGISFSCFTFSQLNLEWSFRFSKNIGHAILWFYYSSSVVSVYGVHVPNTIARHREPDSRN